MGTCHCESLVDRRFFSKVEPRERRVSRLSSLSKMWFTEDGWADKGSPVLSVG
jgi:hypothetical protein